MDFFAIATAGFYPTPTPTAAERTASAATWGYFLGPLTADTGENFTDLLCDLLADLLADLTFSLGG